MNIGKTVALLIGIGTALTAIILLTIAIRRLLFTRNLVDARNVLLELTPPSQSDRSVIATQKLFMYINGMSNSRSWLDHLLGRNIALSLEIVATKNQGIRFLVRTNESDKSSFQQAIRAYVPDVVIKEVDDYITDSAYSKSKLVEIVQSGYFAYPLNSQGMLEDHDAIAYLAGSMTKLNGDELMALQLVTMPVKVREAAKIEKRILYSEELLQQLNKRFSVAGKLGSVISTILFAVVDIVSDIFHDSSTSRRHGGDPNETHKRQAAARIKPARSLSAFEQQLAGDVLDKVRQPLFSVTMRLLIVAEKEQEQRQRIKSFKDWLALFTVPKYQALRVRYSLPLRYAQAWQWFAYTHRLPALLHRHASIFSAGEMSDLYHFPHSQTGRVENVVKSLSKALPAPLSLKSKNDFDIRLGENIYHGARTAIGLTAAERERHVYIVGGTGNGKTTMMLYSMIQDLQSDKGFAFIDPHGDAAETLLQYVPEDRIDDVIYFNPDDLAFPVGLNLLELPDGLSGDDLLREKDLITESTVSVFRKIFSEDDSGGHRIEYVLRNAVQTALTIEGSTLFTIFRLLNNAKYRKKIVAKLEDEDLKNFWKNELGRAGDFQRVKMSAGITAKVGRFLFSASAKRILEQPKSTIDFDDILDDGKILICNFSKGLLGEDTSELFGITVLAKLQLAALRRARVQQSERRPFYLYVDEFQNFATMSFVQMLSEARKYKLCLTMAEQSTSQQDDRRMVDIILANVGTVITFRTGNPADEKYLLPMFAPYIQNGDIANLPSYNFFMRLAAIHSQEPFSGQTIVPGLSGNAEMARHIIEMSRHNYAIQYMPEEEKETAPAKKARAAKTTAKVLLPE